MIHYLKWKFYRDNENNDGWIELFLVYIISTKGHEHIRKKRWEKNLQNTNWRFRFSKLVCYDENGRTAIALIKYIYRGILKERFHLILRCQLSLDWVSIELCPISFPEGLDFKINLRYHVIFLQYSEDFYHQNFQLFWIKSEYSNFIWSWKSYDDDERQPEACLYKRING